MRKLGGQKDLIPENVPELKDEDVAQKLEQIWKLREGAKLHNKLQGEVKEVIQGWVLGLGKKDQSIGQLKCGDFVMSFKVEMKESKPVKYKTKAGKKVKLKFSPEDEDED